LGKAERMSYPVANCFITLSACFGSSRCLAAKECGVMTQPAARSSADRTRAAQACNLA
jgi:hypothetical protein